MMYINTLFEEELTKANDEIKRLRGLLKPLAYLDLTGVTGDIVYQRNATMIRTEDVTTARQALEVK
jgi:hypothetical protein